MPTTYVPPQFARYFAITDDPTAGGSNSDLVIAAGAPFTTGLIPPVTNVWPWESFDMQWGGTDLNYDHLGTGVRASPPPEPFKQNPTLPLGFDGHRYVIERAFKMAMGAEGTITGTGPYVHPIKSAGFGTSQLPAAMVHTIRDGVAVLASGVVFESADLVADANGPSKVTVEAHALYGQIPATATVPTGVLTEPTVKPMLLRDLTLAFDGGSIIVGVSAFRFGFKNNNTYDNQVAGLCVESKVLNSVTYKNWWPCYHRITGRQTVTWGFDLRDSDKAQELRQIWNQLTSVVATLIDPHGSTDQVVITLPASVLTAGGVSAGNPTGPASSSFNGTAHYDVGTATDATVAVTNARATPITII